MRLNILIEDDPEIKHKLVLETAENYGTVFASYAFNYYSWLKNQPKQRMVLVTGKEDYFCTICPKKTKGCFDSGATKMDMETIEFFGFELGAVYTVEELMNGLRRKCAKSHKSLTLFE